MHYPWPQTSLKVDRSLSSLPFPMTDSVDWKVIEEQKTAQFGGNITWVFFIPGILADGTGESFQNQECG